MNQPEDRTTKVVIPRQLNDKARLMVAEMKSAGYTQSHVASLIGVHAVYVSHWMQDRQEITEGQFHALKQVYQQFQDGTLEPPRSRYIKRGLVAEYQDADGHVNAKEALDKRYKRFKQSSGFQYAVSLLKMVGFTQEDISILLGCHQPTVSRYMSDLRVPQDVLVKMYQLFDENLPKDMIDDFEFIIDKIKHQLELEIRES